MISYFFLSIEVIKTKPDSLIAQRPIGNKTGAKL